MLTDFTRHFPLIFSSSILAFLVAFSLTPYFIKFLQKNKIGKQIRETDTTGKQASIFRTLHLKKSGTPTMGGVLIWGTVLIVVLFSRLLSYFGLFDKSLLNRKETYLPLFTLVAVALLGAIDDIYNIKSLNKAKGLNVKPKFLWLTLFAILGGVWFHYKLGYDLINIPFIGDFNLGWFYIPVFAFIIIASANAVNITDGLDGLAAGLLTIAFVSSGIIAYSHGLVILTAFCGIISGATLAFLWFNVPPAKFYMGDTGALSLGATLGVLAMLTDTILILPLIASVFVIETLSVIIQLFSKKYFHKKVFDIAPLHHHLENRGWPESQVTMRFWIIGAIMAGFGVVLSLLSL